MIFEQVPARLARILLELVDADDGQLPTQLTHEELARLVGTTRSTVTRTLTRFARQGLVEVGYHHLLIRDADGLRREAGLSA